MLYLTIFFYHVLDSSTKEEINVLQDEIKRKDPRTCISPENKPWPFYCSGISNNYPSDSNRRSCELCAGSAFSKFLIGVIEKMKVVKRDLCYQLVVYSVAFGSDFKNAYDDMAWFQRRKWHSLHNRCFFMFVLEEDTKKNKKLIKTEYHSENFISNWTSSDGLRELILVPKNVLPYESLRRNTKLFKMIGHLIFPWAARIIWQDYKFGDRFRNEVLPQNYFEFFKNTVDSNNVCFSFLSLPTHRYTVKGTSSILENGFQRHCDLIASMNSTSKTDTLFVQDQCNFYQRQIINVLGMKSDILSNTLIDSSFFARDMRSQRCRKFIAELSCKWLDEIHCFSDRDQISFPYVLANMGVTTTQRKIDLMNENRVFYDIRSKQPLVLLLKGNCHHYFHNMRRCSYQGKVDQRDQIESINKTIAILVAGTFGRYMLQTSIDHLIKPLVKQGYDVHYYLSLSTAKASAYRGDSPYMNHLEYDPIFEMDQNKEPVAQYIESIVRKQIEQAGGILKHILIQNSIDIDNNTLVKLRRSKTKESFPRENPDLRFPVIDLRPGKASSTIVANQNLLRLHLAVQMLWESLVQYENFDSFTYKHVFFLRDDTFWIHDFDFNKLLAQAEAELYVLSCDARNPKMLPSEINDHSVICNRFIADLFGMYFTHLLTTKSAIKDCGNKFKFDHLRGCNSEMLLNWHIQQNNFIVKKVDQGIIPFQRSVNVQYKGNVTTCFHKYCQSHSNPLDDAGLKRCKNLIFP